jgi:hypothetical protein
MVSLESGLVRQLLSHFRNALNLSSLPIIRFLTYNETMKCPNDNTEMYQVKIEGHYSRPILLEQCKECGGIWFDEMA